jgi:hypothetical protein
MFNKIIRTLANTLKQKQTPKGKNYGSEGLRFESPRARHFSCAALCDRQKTETAIRDRRGGWETVAKSICAATEELD